MHTLRTSKSVYLRGLTLGEMLIVLLVFSILATFFMLSSSFALVKSRYSRVLQEQRVLTQQLERYNNDFSTVPTGQSGLQKLTYPISYITHVPNDPFNADARSSTRQYAYYSNLSPKYRWLVVSVGPDGMNDLDNIIEKKREEVFGPSAHRTGYDIPFMTDEEVNDLVRQFSYDPTNGSVSRGDVISW